MNSVYHCPIAYCDWEHQDFYEYYFHSLYYVPEDSEDNTPCEYSAYPHERTFQDSFLISAYNKGQECNELVDVRYFPHYQNIEFYAEYTKPLYKEVIPENAEKEPPVLPDGDLYPAGVY